MLKIMRKIFCLLILLFLSAKPASATVGQPCCPAGTTLMGDLKCADNNGNDHENACNTAVGETCDSTKGVNGECTGTVTKDAGCPADAPYQIAGCSDVCCVQAYPAQTCKWKDGVPLGVHLTYDCDFVKQWAVKSSPKNDCGSDGTYHYDAEKKTCVQDFKSTWELKNHCDNGTTGVQTALGCVPTKDLNGFLTFLLKFALGISGGVILLLVISTGYTVLTSAGNPEKLQAAKENIVALFTGLLLIAFSLILLQTIGRDILNLPTF